MYRNIKRAAAIALAGIIISTTTLAKVKPLNFGNDSAYVQAAEKETLGQYLKEVKIAMGENDKVAIGEAAQLAKEGYSILENEKGAFVDLNKGAGSLNILKKGPSERTVYLAYKTTDNPEEAITDMATMNMNGGYSIEDYKILMEEYMDKQIKPFMDNFIYTLEEYRENYRKKDSSLGHIRANYIRQMLNKLKDDDTGKPVGDLLLNQTKYEMEEAEYNKLSDDEKKKHADILTMLTQANGQATLTMETLLAKATDSTEKKDKKTKKIKTWVDRFVNTSLDDLYDEMKEGHPEYTKTDVYKALDTKYYDSAMKILGESDSKSGEVRYSKWDVFRDDLLKYEDISDEIEDNVNDSAQKVEDVMEQSNEIFDNDEIRVVVYIDEEKQEDEKKKVEDYINENDEAKTETAKQAMDLQTLSLCEYLDSIKYGEDDETLLEFFTKESDEVTGKNGIRKLYPIVEALTAGQEAGLDFLSLSDLFSIALADENTYKNVNDLMVDVEPVSIYENVERDIYKEGGVALTSDAIRAKAKSSDIEPDSGYKMSTLPIVLWTVTAGSALATAITLGAYTKLAKGVTEDLSSLNIKSSKLAGACNKSGSRVFRLMKVKGYEVIEDSKYVSEVTKAPSTLFKALAVGTVLLTVIATAASVAMTIKDLMDYYDTEFIPIPNFIVEEADITAYNKKNEKIVVKNQSAYYRVAECTRFEGRTDTEKKNYEILGTHNDLNGDIGKEWLSLYTVKYDYGNPILADSLKCVEGDGDMPSGYKTGVHMFGSKAVCNLNNKQYLYVKNPPTIKLYFKTSNKSVEELLTSIVVENNASTNNASANNASANKENVSSVTASIFSDRRFFIGAGCGLILGAAITIFFVRRRRKKAGIK